jgi:hypothetical protein
MPQYLAPSIFFFIEVSACTTLSKAMTADTPDAWILGSVVESLD